MTKQEFIDALSMKLSEDLDAGSVYNETRYYIGYIDAETAKGRTEEEVTEELGDPILIARNIVDSPRSLTEAYAGDSYEQGYSEAQYQAQKRENAPELRPEAEEVDFQELPPYKEPEPAKTFDNGFFDRQPEQKVEKTTGSSGFMRGADGNFNWGLITGILITVLIVVVIISIVARVISFFGPLIVVIAVFSAVSSFFKRR